MLLKITPEKISKWEENRKINTLKRLKKKKDENIKKIAANSLNRIINSCIEDLKISKDFKTKLKATRILSKTKDPCAVEPLLSTLFSTLKYSDYRNKRLGDKIIQSLGKIRDKRAITPLSEILSYVTWGEYQDRSFYRYIIIPTLKKIGGSEALSVVKNFEEKIKEEEEEKSRGRTYSCSACKKPISKYSSICPHCRAKLHPALIRCLSCGYSYSRLFNECPKCGRTF
jgi:hypothetical protein